MAVRQVREMGDEVLNKVSKEVKVVTPRTLTLIEDMLDTMYETNGVGLAAPQVGVLRRIFIIDIDEGYFEFINPVIISTSGSQTDKEGCLSVQDRYGEVERPMTVKIQAQDRHGKKFTLKAKGFFARAICHEYDHLDGILYIDKANKMFVESK